MSRGRPPKEGKRRSFNLTIPEPLYLYLENLARNKSFAGADVGEIVAYILKARVAELGVRLDVLPTLPAEEGEQTSKPGPGDDG